MVWVMGWVIVVFLLVESRCEMKVSQRKVNESDSKKI